MHERVITIATEWIESNVGTSTSKAELAEKSRSADLPHEVHEAIEELPEGAYDRDQAISTVQDSLLAKLGAANAAMRGFGGSA